MADKTNTRPPGALTEHAITRHMERVPGTGAIVEDPTLRLAWRALSEGRGLAEQGSHAFETIMADASKPNAENLIRARKTIGHLAGTITRKIDVAKEKLESEVDSIKKNSWRPEAASTASAIAIERQVADCLRSMPREERGIAIARAIDSNDEVTLSAVLGASPGFTCGISEDEKEMRRHHWRTKNHAAAIERQRRMEAALRDINQAGAATLGWVERLFNDSPVAKLVKQSEAAAAVAVAAAEAAGVDGE